MRSIGEFISRWAERTLVSLIIKLLVRVRSHLYKIQTNTTEVLCLDCVCAISKLQGKTIIMMFAIMMV